VPLKGEKTTQYMFLKPGVIAPYIFTKEFK